MSEPEPKPASGKRLSATEQKRAEAKAARERLIGTVNELGGAIQDTKRRATEKARAAAPFVVGGIGAIAALKVLRRRR